MVSLLRVGLEQGNAIVPFTAQPLIQIQSDGRQKYVHWRCMNYWAFYYSSFSFLLAMNTVPEEQKVSGSPPHVEEPRAVNKL